MADANHILIRNANVSILVLRNFDRINWIGCDRESEFISGSNIIVGKLDHVYIDFGPTEYAVYMKNIRDNYLQLTLITVIPKSSGAENDLYSFAKTNATAHFASKLKNTLDEIDSTTGSEVTREDIVNKFESRVEEIEWIAVNEMEQSYLGTYKNLHFTVSKKKTMVMLDIVVQDKSHFRMSGLELSPQTYELVSSLFEKKIARTIFNTLL